ncbi:SDR family NAD(P)-dependent oxidoreductase [Sphingobium estronivorans]|uniref:SDR family NAD(P)-dependent oxidoreductase n=1 Tax=Sphingobium estronivorans TaxID=1577690 RepID=UPI001239B73B|nr:SDR family oxidoreductase [Sphingobium estronivorans]
MTVHDLRGKRIIIGGGATGIGAALAARLTGCGAHVVVGDINGAGLDALMPGLEGPGTALPVVFDLADDASIDRLVQRCLDRFGGVDGLAIAGADLSPATADADRPVLDMDSRVWEHVFRVNTIGHARLMKAAMPHMINAGGGAIAVVTSGAAFMGSPTWPAYASSKAALGALVRSVALAYGKFGVRCNGVNPGRIVKEGDHEAPINALDRIGRPDDAARVLTFLISEESGWITGQILSANGGSSFRE